MPSAVRGEVWLVDLGIAAKTRPCLVISVPAADEDRALVAVVPHTTSVRGTRFEIAIPKNFLKAGAFDPQGLVSVPPPRLVRKLGALTNDEMSRIEEGLKLWLGL